MDAPDHDLERIGPTAHYTAYVWRRLGLPYADRFATGKGAVLYWGFFVLGEWTTRVLPAVPSMREYLEYRHRLIDAAVHELDPDCVVELGAGLTPRAVQWALDHDVRAIEIDLPGLAEIKQHKLDRLPATERRRLASRHQVVADDVLAPGFGQRLAQHLKGSTQPVVIAEGLLSYFDLKGRVQALRAVGEALAAVGGGTLLCDLHTAPAQAQVGRAAHVLRGAIRGLTSRQRALDPFADFDALMRAFETAGFEKCRVVETDDYRSADPRLVGLRSPVHVVMACVRR